MKNRVQEQHYYSTYYFADIVANVLQDPFPYIRNLGAFCGDLNTQYFLRPFPLWSALHKFIAFIAEDLFFEEDLEGEDRLSARCLTTLQSWTASFRTSPKPPRRSPDGYTQHDLLAVILRKIEPDAGIDQ
jgi:hypothetical protein